MSGLCLLQTQPLVIKALKNLNPVKIDENEIDVCRTKTNIWGEERTVIVFISEKLKSGQIRGIYQMIDKNEKKLNKLQTNLSNPKAKKRNRKQAIEQIDNILKSKIDQMLINWELKWSSKGKYKLTYGIDTEEIEKLEENFGIRIIMTNRHNLSTKDIIKAYYGQSNVEKAFKELKNPIHLSVKPQYHWTDQKIKVHNLICVISYLLSTIILREVRQNINFKGCLNTLFNMLKNIRLGVIIEKTKKKAKLKINYKIEEMEPSEEQLIQGLNLEKFHIKRPKFKSFSIYN